jgi:hypothetical protein
MLFLIYRFAVKMGDSALQSGCLEDPECLKGYICDIVANTEEKCDQLPWPEVK